jgi:hypothetical protein
LRLLGVAAVVASVLLADQLSRTAALRRTLVPALVAATFLSTPLFGTTTVHGELLAVPLVLAGILALVRGWLTQGPQALIWGVVAGATGVAAALVKQNVLDVFVVAAALVLLAVRARLRVRACALGFGVLTGAAVALCVCLVWAEMHGTEPTRLWDAVVTFRAQAAAVIHSSSTGSTSQRFIGLLGAAALSGAPLLVTVLALRARRPTESDRMLNLRVPAAALLMWELVGIAGGGSYWLHYLTGLVPGLVLLATAADQRRPSHRRWTAVAVAFAIVSSIVATVTAAITVPSYSADTAVATYLKAHSKPHDTVVVGFGHANIVYDSGLRSPYEQLWSLPVRVRDPHLSELTRVLDGRRAPTWVVVNGTSLETWGVDATMAQQALLRSYRPATTIGDYLVWKRRAVR